MAAPTLQVYSNGQSNAVSGDQLNTFEQTCNTFADLRAFPGTAGLQVSARGGVTVGDLLGGDFYWNPSSTAADDGSNVIAAQGQTIGRWLRLGFFMQSQQSASILNPITDFGGVSSPTFNNTAAFTAAALTGEPIFIPYGTGDTYKTTLNKATGDFPNRMWGDGVVSDVTPNNLGRFFTYIDSAPSSLGNENNILTAFNGDWSRSPFPVEHWITGVATLGQPTSGYLYTPEAYPHYTFLYNASGWNNATNSNVGRTAAVANRIKVYQHGQGDAVAFNAAAFVDSTLAGSTDVLANPAVALFNGNALAGIAGAYLNLIEVDASDGGFDVAAAGFVTNLTRTVTTGAKNAFWFGARVQSVGSGAIDAAYSATGPMRFGLDLSNATLDANKAGIALSQDQRIYLAVTPGNLFPSAVNTTFMLYQSNIGAIHFVNNNQSVLQLYNSQIFALQPFRVVNTADSGAANSNTLTGVSDVTANSTGVGTILFKGATSRNSLGFVKMYVGTTAVFVPAFSAITG